MVKKLSLGASPFMKDVFWTTLSSFVVMLGMVLTISILARTLGPEQFGAYSLARRFISFVIPFTTFGLGITLTRYLAIAGNDELKGAYIHSASLIYIIIAIFSVLLGLIFNKQLILLVFRDLGYSQLYYLSLLMIVGMSFYMLLYSYYRGTDQVTKANSWNALLVGISPLFIAMLTFYGVRLETIFLLMGLVYFFTIGPIVLIFKKLNVILLQLKRIQIKEMLVYSTPRIPGQMFFTGLMAIGPFCAPYFGSISDAGLIAIGQSIFRVMQFTVAGFGFAALPKVSEIFAKGNQSSLESKINDLLEMILQGSLLLVVLCFVWTDVIVSIWLGDKYANAVPIIQIFLFSLCPYLLYVMLRSIIDAVEVKAYNTMNTMIALVVAFSVTFILGSLGWGVTGIAIGSSAGFAALGLLTMIFVIRRFKITIFKWQNILLIMLNAFFAVLIVFLKRHLLGDFSLAVKLLSMTAACMICFVIYYYVLDKLNVRWLEEIRIRLKVRFST